MAQPQIQSSSENKVRLMEEEMNRFEAEIAHHQSVATSTAVDASTCDAGGAVVTNVMSGGSAAAPMGLNFSALQATAAVINSGLFPTAGVSSTQAIYTPPQMVSYQPTAVLPNNLYSSSSGSVLTPTHQQFTAFPSSADKPSTMLIRKVAATTASCLANSGGGEPKTKSLATTVIVAPPQMAGPNELAARAKETAAARSKSTTRKRTSATTDHRQVDDIEVDDDVTRALLAAVAGVTYTRVQATDGKQKTIATVAKTATLAGKSAAGTLSTANQQQKQPPLSIAPPLLQQQQLTSLHSVVVGSSTPPTSLIPNQLMSVPPPNYRYVSTGTNTGISSSGGAASKSGKKSKRFLRIAAGTVWEDPTLAEWDPNDFRIFCGDLGNEVSVDTLSRAFNRYPSFQKAHVVRDKRTGKSRGYGFVSFSDPADFARAMREMNGKYVGNRPIKLKRSDWRVRQLDSFRKKEKEKKKLGLKN